MSPLNCSYSNSIIKIMTNDKTDRIINRILEVDNFQNMACCCDNFSEFVTEILEWGVDHIAGVDFFDSFKSFRELWADVVRCEPSW